MALALAQAVSIDTTGPVCECATYCLGERLGGESWNNRPSAYCLSTTPSTTFRSSEAGVAGADDNTPAVRGQPIHRHCARGYCLFAALSVKSIVRSRDPAGGCSRARAQSLRVFHPRCVSIGLHRDALYRANRHSASFDSLPERGCGATLRGHGPDAGDHDADWFLIVLDITAPSSSPSGRIVRRRSGRRGPRARASALIEFEISRASPLTQSSSQAGSAS